MSPLLLEYVYIPEEQSSCRTVVYACGFEPFVDPLNAQVAVLYNITYGVVLRYPEWTGFHTNQAADTFLSVKEDDSVWALGYGVYRARLLAGWLGAVHTVDGIEFHSQLS